MRSSIYLLIAGVEALRSVGIFALLGFMCCNCPCIAQVTSSRSKSTSLYQSTSKGPVTLRASGCSCKQCYIAEAGSFRIHWCAEKSSVLALANTCEELRSNIAATWIPEQSKSDWMPRCEIVVHRDVAAYTRHLGRGSEQTSGCATVSLDHGRVVFRRIDLRADAPEWRTESLPHELTHVVLADRFAKKRIPPWVDEGIAMLAESPEKLGRRCNALQSKLRTGHPPTIQSTINLTERNSSLDADVFYGQSVGLVAYLLERGAPHQLLEFVESAQSADYETAMRDVYGIEGWEIFERGWRGAMTQETLRKLARHEVANDVAIFRQAADVNPLQATAP